MTMTADLVARSAELKGQLLDFARQPRYGRAFGEALLARDLTTSIPYEDQLILFMDHFVLQHRLRNGRTVVEQFVASRPDLPQNDRDLLLGWRDVVEGVFEVQRRDGEALIMQNLIDELAYRVRCNMGTAVFRRMPRRAFVIARLVPIGHEWLISGSLAVFPATERDYMYRAAAENALQEPALMFRNPDKLAEAWELQRADRDRFRRFFGTDLVVLAGDQFAARMRQYHDFVRTEILGTDAASDGPRPTNSSAAIFDVEPDLAKSATVGVIYDEVEGMNFYAEFGMVEAVFTDPTLLRNHPYSELLTHYLDDDTVSPLPFRRLADRNPDRVSELFGKLLGRPGFEWRRDGEQLLRERKAAYFDRPPMPSISPISDRLSQYI